MKENITDMPVVVDDKNQAVKRKIDNSKGYQWLGRKYFPVLSGIEDVQLFRIHKSEILSAAQKLVLKHALSEEKLKKATFLQLVQGFEILNKAERLENNLSTENVSMKFSKSVPGKIINDGAND